MADLLFSHILSTMPLCKTALCPNFKRFHRWETVRSSGHCYSTTSYGRCPKYSNTIPTLGVKGTRFTCQSPPYINQFSFHNFSATIHLSVSSTTQPHFGPTFGITPPFYSPSSTPHFINGGHPTHILRGDAREMGPFAVPYRGFEAIA